MSAIIPHDPASAVRNSASASPRPQNRLPLQRLPDDPGANPSVAKASVDNPQHEVNRVQPSDSAGDMMDGLLEEFVAGKEGRSSKTASESTAANRAKTAQPSTGRGRRSPYNAELPAHPTFDILA
jgi:hypothetical protein